MQGNVHVAYMLPTQMDAWSSTRGLRMTGAWALEKWSHSAAHRLAVEHRRAGFWQV